MVIDRPPPTGIERHASVGDETRRGWRGANDTDSPSAVSTIESGRGMQAILACHAHPSISCDRAAVPTGLALVLEADLDLDAVLDDLAVGDDRGRLHDLDRLDGPDCPRRGGDCLAGGVAPRPWARSDHLPDDDDAHRSTSTFVRPRTGCP